ncbi:hypothetical protein [Metabacillus halosaccharovorans]|nr:hypothetical protein [Metabacillus halosaccharovorans]
MGKRKSSPRLATTSTNRCCYYSLSPIHLSVYMIISKKILLTY